MLFAGADAALDELQSDFRIATSPGIVTTGGIVQLVDTTQTIRDYVSWGDTPGATLTLPTGRMLERQYIDTIPSITGSMTKDFVSKLIDTQLPRGGGYIAYVAPVNRCEGIIISEIAANVAVDQQFVELYNPTDHSIDTTGCLLQTNRSTTKHHELSGTVQPGQYIALPIAAIQLTLTKTTTGTVYLLSSDGKEETDARSYDSLATNTSWSWFGEGDWRQTFALTPNAPNAWQEFLPCSDGYERNWPLSQNRR
jgi:hypothetical protein